MKSFVLETWDAGRLTVNAEFADTLRAQGLESFAAIMNYDGGVSAKALLKQRTTTRVDLPLPDGQTRAFFLKRHGPSPWKEYIKPWIRLRRPILGARNEWCAIQTFWQAGIPTMIPVAFGESGASSFLLTAGIPDCQSLADWLESQKQDREQSVSEGLHIPPELIETVASTARTMHENQLNHQDFYLYHLLVPHHDLLGKLFVIDLGRAQRHRHLGRRWIVKDLAQLNYSAASATLKQRLRFLRSYLNRPLQSSDRRLMRRIARKSAAIARHSRRHAL